MLWTYSASSCGTNAVACERWCSAQLVQKPAVGHDPTSPVHTACLLKILHLLDLLFVIGSFPSRLFAKTFKMYTCVCSVSPTFQ